MKLERLLIVALSALLLAACQSTPQNFVTMSEQELYAYNAEVPVMDQVICRKETRTSTYIRKTRCQTVRQITHELEDSIMALQVLSFGDSGPFFHRD